MRIWMVVAILFLTGCTAQATPMNTPVAVDVYGTSAAAQVQLERAQLAMTGTSQAQIIPITQTAAAWAMEQAAAQATDRAVATASAQAATGTASAWTATPNYTATVQAAEVSATVQSLANDGARDDLALERTRTMNSVYAFMPMLLALLMITVALMFGITWARRFAVISVPTDDFGNSQPMLDVVDGTVVDSKRMANAVTGLRHADLKLLPAVTVERQDAVVGREKLMRGAHSKSDPRLQIENVEMPQLTESASQFKLPEWQMMLNWDGKGGLPVGVSARGLELMDLNVHPHVGVIGKTGSGKSRRFLRPFIAGALRAGHKVAIIGKMVDFLPFRGQAGVSMFPIRELTMEAEATRYALILRGMVEEMNKRDEILSREGKSTWAQAGRESTLVVLDELGNAIDLMPREQSIASYRYINGLVKEGRKVGFNLIFASQRAKGFRDIMTQVGRAVFFVQDEMESRNALGVVGAESLQDGYFFGRFGSRALMGSFMPSDEELTAFLNGAGRQVSNDNSLDGLLSSEIPLMEQQGFGEDVKRKVLEMYQHGAAKSRIIRDIWGVTGGSSFLKWFDMVSQLVDSKPNS